MPLAGSSALQEAVSVSGLTLADLEAALKLHGEDSYRLFGGLSTGSSANSLRKCRKNGYPSPYAVAWLMSLRAPVEGPIGKRHKRSPFVMAPNKEEGERIAWARARYCLVNRVWESDAEARLVERYEKVRQWQSITTFLERLPAGDVVGVVVP